MGATHFSGPVYSTNGFISGNPAVVPVTSRPAPTTIATAGNATYSAPVLLTGTILRDPAGANRTDVLPTAAQLVAAMGASATVGSSFDFLIINTSAGAFTVQITMGTGGTAVGANTLATIPQNGSRWFTLRMTNVTPGAEAYSVYA